MTEFQTIELGPVSLNVEVSGEGPAIIFIHGFTTTSGFWRNQVDVLAQDHKVVRFDLRGHGDSAKPRGVPYTIEAFSDDLVQLMGRLGIDDAVLVGLSMGGSIVMRTALDHPELVKALVLVDTSAAGVGEAIASSRVLSQIQAVGVETASSDVIEHSFAASADRSVVDWAKQEVTKAPVHVATEAIVSLGTFDVRDDLEKIGCPTIIIVGEEDEITPISLSERLNKGIAGSELVIIRGSNHFPMLEQPAVFNKALMEFLESIK
jgi:pimeloyl-ACP methyl ester carboxylesterase